MANGYDYKELKAFLLPEHKWFYFSIRAVRTSGWLYFTIGSGTVLGTFMISDQPKHFWTITGNVILALVGGCNAVKAYRSQSPKELAAEEAAAEVQKPSQ